MNKNKDGSKIKMFSDEELKERLQVLAERDREAVVVFAARCVLRILPFTAGKEGFDYWSKDKRAKYASSLFIVCVQGLDYERTDYVVTSVTSIINNAVIDMGFSRSSAAVSVSAISAFVQTTSSDPSAISLKAYNAYIASTSTSTSITFAAEVSAAARESASSDIVELEQNNIFLVKIRPLWLGTLSAYINTRTSS